MRNNLGTLRGTDPSIVQQKTEVAQDSWRKFNVNTQIAIILNINFKNIAPTESKYFYRKCRC